MKSALANLTPYQRHLLAKLAKSPVYLPYGDGEASALLLGGFAERSTTFGNLVISDAGREALKPTETTDSAAHRHAAD